MRSAAETAADPWDGRASRETAFAAKLKAAAPGADVKDLDPILDDYFEGRINLERFRGRSAYTFPVQAAELAVRERTGLEGIHDVELVHVSREDEDRWLVTLRAAGQEFAAEAWAERGEEPVYLTCNSVTPQRPRRFRARLR